MAKYLVEDTSLTAVADAIRTKGGTTGELEFPGGFVSAVEEIQTGGGGEASKIILTTSFPTALQAITALTPLVEADYSIIVFNGNEPAANQLTTMTFVGQQAVSATRYRNNTIYDPIAKLNNTYDAVGNVGDEYTVLGVNV